MFTTRKIWIPGGVLVALAVVMTSPTVGRTRSPLAADLQLAHMVYFKLKDNSGGSRAKLVAACKLQLAGHEGVTYFATGMLAGDLRRDVNDRDFDVSLHMIFNSKAAHDKYQQHERHLKFIEENKGNWEKVRVFDSYLSPRPAGTRQRIDRPQIDRMSLFAADQRGWTRIGIETGQ